MRILSQTRLLLVCLLLLLAGSAGSQQQHETPAEQRQAADLRFLRQRGIGSAVALARGPAEASASLTRLKSARAQQAALARSSRPAAESGTMVGSSTSTWLPLGPLQINTAAYGLVTGRISSMVVDPNDPTGNTVYIGATGGGVWKSTNAAGSAASVSFAPLTDDISAFANSFQSVPSLSIGAVSVEPGNSEIVLAGTGDPNDALDSYYGVGLLRSTDGGNSWRLIQQSSDVAVGGVQNYQFTGVGFAGFAWSTTTSGLVVAAVSQSLEGLLVNPGFETTAEAGLYYSQDAGVTWHLATVSDGTNEIIQSSDPPTYPPGNAATAVVWNPQRRMFIAAIRFHGYYSSTDGVNWTRLANQPGAGLSTTYCPANPGSIGSASCPIFRGALAVQPVTGDTFALTTDINNADQGLYRDVCSSTGLAATTCSSSTIAFGTHIADTALDDPVNPGYIDQADYNLSLAAVPSQQDTLLFAGTEDIFRCSLANSCAWRNTTNDQTCTAAGVAPSTHAITAVPSVSGLIFFGNDGGLWRSTDGVAQSGSVCASTDASHYQNLNSGLGSLAEIEHIALSPSNPALVLAGTGGFGTIASESAAAQTGNGAWQQLLTGEGNFVAIDPARPDTWYATSGEGASIYSCPAGGSCTAADFGTSPVIGRSAVEDDSDYAIDPIPWILDPGNTANVLLGTCRVWLGPAVGNWTASDLLSHMLDGDQQTNCDGNAYLRSIAAGGSYNSSLGGERMYAGMAGWLDGGGDVPGHLYGATVPQSGGVISWTDLWNNPVTNTSLSSQFNGSGDGVAAVTVDPHDPTGNTIYVGIAGFPTGQSGILYASSDGGAHWINITNSLPFAPVNAIVVDPANPNYVYVGGDFGVFYTSNVANCVYPSLDCWAQLASGLPNAPVTDLKIAASSSGDVLEAATYGRGIWTLGLTTSLVAPTATLSPTAYTFPAQAVGSSSTTAASFTLRNTGSVALTIGQIAVTGDFSQTNQCGGSLAAGSSCTMQVTFTPTATGSRSGVLSVDNNTQSGTLSATLNGTGASAGTLTLSPTSVIFPQTAMGGSSQASNITVQNTGGAALTISAVSLGGADPGDFSVGSGNTCAGSLAVAASCTVPVIFNPYNAGTRTATLQIAANVQGSPFSVSLTGAAVAPAHLVLSPTSLTFTSTIENTVSSAQSLTISNTGTQAAQVGTASVSGDFLLASNSCGSTLASAATCTVAIEFAPTASGTRTGTFTLLSSTQPNGQISAPLNGTGLAAPQVSLSPASLAFGSTTIGTASSAQSATFTNNAALAATIIGVNTSEDFAVTGGTCITSGSVAAGSSCSVLVTFNPTAAGSRSGTLTITSNGTPASAQTSLTGSGATPASLGPNPSSLSFGSVALQSSQSASITLTNSGGTAASLTAPSVSGNGYSLGTTGCSATLAANASCTVSVTFSPTALGESRGSLTLSGQFSGSPINVSLDGTGVANAVTLQPSPVAFSSIPAGTTTTLPVTATNISSAAVSLGTPSVTSGFTLSSACGSTLAAGASCIIQVTFAPTAAGATSGTLTLPAIGGGAATDALTGTALAPGALSASPTSLSFGSSTVGTGTAAQTVTFRNSGGSALALNAPVFSTSDYSATSNSCGSSLDAGGSCTIAVIFDPAASGNSSATLTLSASGSGNATATVTLAGTGVAPPSLAFSPATVSFGSTYLNTTSPSQTLTLKDTGGSPASISSPVITGPFAILSTTCGATLAATASCSVVVQYAPTATGAQSGSVTVTGGPGSLSATASLSGTGTALEAAPTAIAFTPPLAVGGTSSPVAIAIENLGNTAVSLSAPSITGDFAMGPSSCGSTLAAQSTCAVYITFTPTAAGQRTGVFTISSGSQTLSVQLSGIGLGGATDTLSPTSLTFGTTTIGQVSAAQSVTLTNTGDSTLTQISTSIAGPFQASNNCGATLGGHLSCTIAVSFQPISAGSSSGTLTVTDSLHTQTVALNGTANTPAAPGASPLSLDFGSYAVNTATPAQTVTVTNGGGTAMENVAVTSSLADFAVSSSTCGASLAAGANCQVNVTFTASAIGTRQGTLQIASTSLAEPLTVSLSGAGEDFQLAVQGSTSSVITAGQTATYQLTVTPVGASAGTVTLACSGAPANSSCNLNPASVTLSGGSSGSITLSVVTSGATTARVGAAPGGWWKTGIAMALLLPVCLWPSRRARSWLAVLVCAAALSLPVACGVHASGVNDKTAGGTTGSGNSTLTVTASFPGAQRTATVTLVVQ